MTDECIGVTIAPLTSSIYASWSAEMEALVRAKGLWKCTQVLAQQFKTFLGTFTVKEREEIETKFDKAFGSIQCFLDSTCKQISRGSFTDHDLWETFKDQLEEQESDTKVSLLTLLYNFKLEEGSIDVDGYVKSIEAVWRRLKDVNLKFPEKLVVFKTFIGLPSSLAPKEEIWSLKKIFPRRLSRYTCNKKLRD